VSVAVRRAEPRDADFLVALLADADVEPFLSARRPKDRDSLLAEIDRSQREPHAFGLFVIEVDGALVGTMDFEVQNRRSRIAHAGGLAVHPDFRGRRLSDEAARQLQRHLLFDLGFHRIQLEVYGFNERAMRHAERVGFVREGTRRRAYWRHGAWVDGVIYGLLREDIAGSPAVDLAHEYAARHNAGVRDGEWALLAELFADDAVLELAGGPSGPFVGRAAIEEAYRERPPDDELRVLDAGRDGETVVARYAWAAEPEVTAGTLRLTGSAERIDRLVVTFEREPARD
jgi:RimJ/RimL family protein N-acetyltransferase